MFIALHRSSLIAQAQEPRTATTETATTETANAENTIVATDTTEDKAHLEQEARTAIDSKDFEKARRIYRVLAARAPQNIEYQLWIARLSGWLKDYVTAVTIYDEALHSNPDNVDALVGKAYVLMWQQQYSAAQTLLARAAQLTPQSVDVQLATARLYHYQGNARQAKRIVNRVLELDPQNAEARQFASQIELPRPLEARVGYEHFNLSNAPSGDMYHLSIGHITPTRRGALLYERWSRFRETDQRIGFNISQRISQRTRNNLWLRAGVLWGPGATVVPRREYSLGTSGALMRRLIASLDYRYVKFAGARLHIIGPTLEYYLRSGDWLQLSVYRSWTSFNDPPGPDDFNMAYATRYNKQINESLTGYLSYARGNQANALSIDRLTSLRADTYGAGIRWHFAPPYWLDVYGARQKRSNDSRETIFGVALTTRQ